ncbi:MAG: T9SS type A sorting domain-containing protein [bacterium]
MFRPSFIQSCVATGFGCALACCVTIAFAAPSDTLTMSTGKWGWAETQAFCRVPVLLAPAGASDFVGITLTLIYDATAIAWQQPSYERTTSSDWVHATRVYPGRSSPVDTLRVAMVGTKPLSGAGILMYANFTVHQPEVEEEAVRLIEAKLFGRSGSLTALRYPDGRYLDNQPGQTVPEQYGLAQNYPNPFNAGTQFRFQMPKAGTVRIRVFNLLGEVVAVLMDGRLEAGYHHGHWPATDLRGLPVVSGVYFIEMQADNFMEKRKMLLIR